MKNACCNHEWKITRVRIKHKRLLAPVCWAGIARSILDLWSKLFTSWVTLIAPQRKPVSLLKVDPSQNKARALISTLLTQAVKENCVFCKHIDRCTLTPHSQLRDVNSHVMTSRSSYATSRASVSLVCVPQTPSVPKTTPLHWSKSLVMTAC